jgi:hypothetical protein
VLKRLSYAPGVHDRFVYVLFDASKPLPPGWVICDGTNGTLDLSKEAKKVHPSLAYITKPEAY